MYKLFAIELWQPSSEKFEITFHFKNENGEQFEHSLYLQKGLEFTLVYKRFGDFLRQAIGNEN